MEHSFDKVTVVQIFNSGPYQCIIIRITFSMYGIVTPKATTVVSSFGYSFFSSDSSAL